LNQTLACIMLAGMNRTVSPGIASRRINAGGGDLRCGEGMDILNVSFGYLKGILGYLKDTLPGIACLDCSYNIALVPGIGELVPGLRAARLSGLFCFVSLYLY
jgi:hypothetical protein